MNKLVHHRAEKTNHEERVAEKPCPISRWQAERANRLHRKFLTVDAAIARGLTFKQAVRHFKWFWRDRSYRADRNRKVRFGFGTLRRLWLQWHKGGRTPESLRLKYRGLRPAVPAQLLCNFVEFCCVHQFPHMKLAWAEFTARKGWIGRGRQSTVPLKVTYGQLQYYFSGKKFARLQSAGRAIKRAEAHQDKLRTEYLAEIRARVPATPRRRTGLDLSQGGAAL